MQAAIERRRTPFPVAIVVAVLIALIAGVAAGYSLKPATVVNGPTRTVYLSTDTTLPNADACLFINRHKAC